MARPSFNVANAMAAAGAAFAAGAGLHEIRQGLRTFTTSYYLSPGRMNLVNVHNVDVFVDYCHNAPGMRVLGEFVDRYAAQKDGQSDLGRISRIGMICAAGDRRDDDMRELGAVAAQPLRRRRRPRGRAPARPPARARPRPSSPRAPRPRSARRAPAAGRSRSCSTRSRPSATAWPAPTPATSSSCASTSTPRSLAELEQLTQHAQAGAHNKQGIGDPDLDPVEMQSEAEAAGDEAAAAEASEVEPATS